MIKQSLYKLKIPDDVAGLIRAMHPDLKKKIKASLQTILFDPYSGKALRDEFDGLKSFRVSTFRIIYRSSSKKQIEVVTIGPRKRIYEETLRIIVKKG